MITEDYKDFVARQLYEMLWFVTEALERARVSYSLGGGSMIGALREGGIIPWDDDVDLVVLRRDYDAARAAVTAACETSAYECGFNGRVFHVWPRVAPLWRGREVTGLGLDLFVLDELPADERLRSKLFFRLKVLQGMMKKERLDWSHYSFKGKILVFGTRVLGLFFSERRLCEKYDRLSARYAGCGSQLYGILNDVYSLFQVVYRGEWLSGTREVRFGERVTRIYTGAHEMLCASYGDYMTPPPEDQRRFEHVPAY